MKITPSPLGKRVKGYTKELAGLKEMIIAFIFTLLVFGFCYFIENYQLGYAYYNENLEIIGVVHQRVFLNEIKQNYLAQLKEQGYDIANIKMPKIFIENEIIKLSKVDETAIANYYIEKAEVSINMWQVTTQDDLLSYYFKSQQECDNFTKECKKYLTNEEYNVITISGDKILLTTEEVLQQKTTSLKENRKAIAIKRTPSVSVSRGGNTSKRYNAPMNSYIYMSSPYGMRNGSMHTGIDFAAAAGTELYAWKDGIVTYSGWYGNYGYFIAIDHSDGTTSRYAHCSKINVEVGEKITQGATIGYVGNTGRSTGPHLHFEILVNGEFVNPARYL